MGRKLSVGAEAAASPPGGQKVATSARGGGGYEAATWQPRAPAGKNSEMPAGISKIRGPSDS
eukprot:76060-Pyramimonas_sp.AAC.1